MDNNAAEQAIRGFCIGKKNWVMIDTVTGAKANNLNPYRYFELLLSRIPEHLDDHDRSFLEELAPWSENLPAECRGQIN